ncbi:hypothetical protein U0358_06475 [Idiomarina sp. PL1-037]|uniref:hypothetical protein n=1 Tax=Idiomarina sp. PL1-037 TaxID=3095365 RepID=UPI002ACC1AEE|nr:hypothetical protein [Idiomarina sp. PL1-037]WQC54195.1 hypothetical protein U0358_06475 [Idiomarina sp. PL1-037]
MSYEHELIQNHRKWLQQDLKGTASHCALLSLIACRLQRGEMKLKALLKLGSEQGYTPSAVRNILRRLMQAGLIEYEHKDPSIFVRLNTDGQQFLAGV